MRRAASPMPVAWSWSRQGAMPPMPRAAMASMISLRVPCLRTVAPFTDSNCGARERSRISAADAVPLQDDAHAPRREIGIHQQPGLVGEAEQLGEMQDRARALLPAHHDEM